MQLIHDQNHTKKLRYNRDLKNCKNLNQKSGVNKKEKWLMAYTIFKSIRFADFSSLPSWSTDSWPPCLFYFRPTFPAFGFQNLNGLLPLPLVLWPAMLEFQFLRSSVRLQIYRNEKKSFAFHVFRFRPNDGDAAAIQFRVSGTIFTECKRLIRSTV